MTITPEEREDLVALIRDAVADATCAQCELTPGVVREIVREETAKMIGENHAEHHIAVAECIADWKDIKRLTRNHFLTAILTVMTLAFATGIFLLIRGR